MAIPIELIQYRSKTALQSSANLLKIIVFYLIIDYYFLPSYIGNIVKNL